jgi:hypothetical protein
VVPIDPTPAELSWFEGLAGQVPFPIEWRGRTWLDSQFARSPFIAAYYLGDTNAEVLQLLRELNNEQAALSKGVPDAVARVQSVVGRANELDPQYRFRMTSDGEKTQIEILPRYVGAERDRPITMKFRVEIPATTAEGIAKFEEVRRSYDYGTAVDISADNVRDLAIDAPAGLDGIFGSAIVSMGPAEPGTTTPWQVEMVVLDPNDQTVASLDVTLRVQTTGHRGSILAGSDRTGVLLIEAELDVHALRAHTKYSFESEDRLPHDVLPAARFLAAFRKPNRLIWLGRSGGPTKSQPQEGPDSPVVDTAFAEFVSNLALIQTFAGNFQPMAGDITPEDLVAAAAGAALARGEAITLPWQSGTMVIPRTATLGDRRNALETAFILDNVVPGPFVVRVLGVEYPLGRQRVQQVLCRLADEPPRGLLADELEQDIEVRVVPEANSAMMLRLA